MGSGRRPTVDADLALAVVALAGFGAAAAVVGASFPALLLGGLATVAFEAVALRHRHRVRAIWQRTPVRLAALGAALATAAVGARAGIETVPSAGAGAVGAYLLLRGLVAAGLLDPDPSGSRP